MMGLIYQFDIGAIDPLFVSDAVPLIVFPLKNPNQLASIQPAYPWEIGASPLPDIQEIGIENPARLHFDDLYQPTIDPSIDPNSVPAAIDFKNLDIGSVFYDVYDSVLHARPSADVESGGVLDDAIFFGKGDEYVVLVYPAIVADAVPITELLINLDGVAFVQHIYDGILHAIARANIQLRSIDKSLLDGIFQVEVQPLIDGRLEALPICLLNHHARAKLAGDVVVAIEFVDRKVVFIEQVLGQFDRVLVGFIPVTIFVDTHFKADQKVIWRQAIFSDLLADGPVETTPYVIADLMVGQTLND